MATRIAVPVRPVEGGHRAFCQTQGCAVGHNGAPWRSEVYSVKAGAEDDARAHRQWHRAQLPVPGAAAPERPVGVETIALLRVDGDGLAVVQHDVATEDADRIATELLDAHTDGAVELLMVRVRRGRLSLVDVLVPAEVAVQAMTEGGA